MYEREKEKEEECGDKVGEVKKIEKYWGGNRNW